MARTNYSNSRKQKEHRTSRVYSYAEGNTVRQTEEYASLDEEQEVSGREREAELRRSREEQRRNARIRRNQEKAQQMSPRFIWFIGLAAVAILAVTIRYLTVQSSIVSLMSEIEAKEEQLEELKADNAVLERQLQIYVDLDYIYEVATEELGMVHPGDDQVIYYDQVESEYVRQYDEVPR